jgi:hypothetical protein
MYIQRNAQTLITYTPNIMGFSDELVASREKDMRRLRVCEYEASGAGSLRTRNVLGGAS